MRNPDNNEPLLVQIPETGQYLNVRPLIDYFLTDGLDTFQSSIDAKMQSISNLIRSLNTQFTFDADVHSPLEQKIVFEKLYNLRDLFASFTVIKK